MKTKLWFAIGLTVLLSLSSCNDEKEFSNSQLIKSISVTGQDFLDGDGGTRAAYTVDGTGFHFSWTEGDTVGIYPIGGDQVAFPISSGEGSQTARFDGGAWALRSSYSYAAYYPFSSGNYHVNEKAIPVSYLCQSQNGNGSVDCLDKFDYQYSAAIRPDADGNVNISLKHLGSFVRFQLTIPVADAFKSITLQSSRTPFVTSGTFDLTKDEILIIPNTTSSSIAIALNNTATTDDNKVLTVYLMLAPSDLTDSEINILIEGTKYETYKGSVTGKNMAAGKAYSYTAKVQSGTNINGSDVEWDEEGNEITPQYEYVDLGLSVKWATHNVGATAPEEYGDYYAWGETESKDDYSWSTYKYCNGTMTTMTKYCNYSIYVNNGFTDTKTTLDPEDDVAHVKWGGSWRMPTKEECDELMNNCTWTWCPSGNTEYNGVAGWKVTSKKSDYTDRSIFLPAAGCRGGSSLSGAGSYGNYWSGSLDTDCPLSAWYLYFHSDGHYTSNYYNRYAGLSVRPVFP